MVQEDLVSAPERDAAVEAQVVHGGRLGTNLVELGALRLDQLSRALGRQHQMPAVLQEHFERANPEIQGQLDAELAARWHVIPLGLSGRAPKRLLVACTDPLPEDAVRELEAAYGLELLCALAPELRILYHLEQVYGVERLNRFKRIAPTDSGRQPTAGGGAERRRYVQTLDGDEPVKPPGALAKIAVKRIAVPVSGEVEVPGRLSTASAGVSAMRRTHSRDKVGDTLVQTLESSFGQALDVAMILIVREGTAIGWKGFVRDRSENLVEAVALPLSEPGVLHQPYHSRESYFGAPQGGGSRLDERLWRHLGAGVPREVAVVPVELFGEVACLVYGQSDDELPPEAAGGIAELAQAMAAAFHRLVRAAER